MRRLRSRWTVVALVPAFFLAGFALVSALEGGRGGPPDPAAAVGATGEGEVPAVTVVVPQTTEPAATDGGTTGAATGETTGDPPPSQTDDGAGTTTERGGDRGGAPTAPPSGTIAVDYGPWAGQFTIDDTAMIPDFAAVTIEGEFRYLGGADCPLGNVTVKGWFFDADGLRVGTGLWESLYATGEGGEVPQREPLYLEVFGSATGPVDSAVIRITNVECL